MINILLCLGKWKRDFPFFWLIVNCQSILVKGGCVVGCCFLLISPYLYAIEEIIETKIMPFFIYFILVGFFALKQQLGICCLGHTKDLMQRSDYTISCLCQ